MNNKAIPFSILLFFQCLICYSQKVEEKFHFNSINQGGLLAGASDGTGLLQSINGVLHKTFFAGIGVGLDYYLEKTVPVFLDIRKDLSRKNKTPFVYADCGHHFLLKMNEDPLEFNRKGGLYYDLGIGYKVPAFKKVTFTCSAGYSYKNFSKDVNVMPWWSAWQTTERTHMYNYQLRRISIKAGLVF